MSQYETFSYSFFQCLIVFSIILSSTKLFIRSPRTLFAVEDAYQARKHFIVTIIQKIWKGRQQRLKYLKMRQAAIIIEKWLRRFCAQKEAERRHKAVNIIRK